MRELVIYAKSDVTLVVIRNYETLFADYKVSESKIKYSRHVK